MFQFPGFASPYGDILFCNRMGCPIRISADRKLFAPPRSFSQLVTSFFASESQGIHHAPLLISSYFIFSYPDILSLIHQNFSRFSFIYFSSMSKNVCCGYSAAALVLSGTRCFGENQGPDPFFVTLRSVFFNTSRCDFSYYDINKKQDEYLS